MKGFETKVRRAKHLLQYEHTYRYLYGHGIEQVRQPTLDILACIACRQSRGLEASAIEMEVDGCTTAKDVNRIGKRLADAKVLFRDAIHRDDPIGGKPRFDHRIVLITDGMRQELLANRPCQRGD